MKSLFRALFSLLALSTLLNGCAVYGPPAYSENVYPSAPVYVQPAPVYVYPSVFWSFDFGYWGGGGHHWRHGRHH